MQRTLRLTLGAALAAAALPVLAQADFGPRAPQPYADLESPRDIAMMPVAVADPVAAGSPIHAGGGNSADDALARQVAAAIADDPRIDGATVTVSASNGSVMLSGSTENPQQAQHAEQTAREVAGVTSVSGTLSNTGG